MKLKRTFSLFLVFVFLFALCAPITALAASRSKTCIKTQTVFSMLLGYAKDSFVWEVQNGKVISSSASQASSPILLIYNVSRQRITCTAKTPYYHEYQSVYRINVLNKTLQDIFKKYLGVTVSLGYREITATYRLNGDGTFKYVYVSY